MAILSPQTYSLEELLTRRRYQVPLYQRPFTWTIDQASALFDDIEKNEAPYFLGILVFQKYPDDNKLCMIVDGQQRMATLILLLRSAIELLGKNDKDSIKLQDTYINQQKVGKDLPKFVLTLNDRDKFNFFTLINDSEYYPTKHPPGIKPIRYTSPKKLKIVKDVLSDKLAELMNKIGRDNFINFIVEKVLEVHFVEVMLEDDNDVYLFFETLNARGIDLTISDLLKNYVCSISSDKPSASKNVDEITDIVGEGKMNSFLLHYSIALSENSSPPTKKRLMNWYSEIIDKERDLFLPKLKDYANIYSLFLDPNKVTYSPELKDTLTSLKVLGATRCYPLLLVGHRNLHPKDFVKLCEAVEKLTFRHSTIAGKDAKVLEEEYYKLLLQIKITQDVKLALEQLKFLANQITDDVFEANFKAYEPESNLIGKYVLYKLDNYLSKHSIQLNWNDISLEHILAPGGASWEGKQEYEGKLGNMILLKGKLNKSVGIKSYKEKKEMYKKEDRVLLTKYVVEKYQDFTKKEIIEYQQYLTKLSIEVWKP